MQRLVEMVNNVVGLLLADQSVGNVGAAMSNRIQHLNCISHEHRLNYALLQCLQILSLDLVIQCLINSHLSLHLVLFVCVFLANNILIERAAAAILLVPVSVHLSNMKSTYFSVSIAVVGVLERAQKVFDFVVQ